MTKAMNLASERHQAFFATTDFTIAWYVYRQWLEYQLRLGRNGEVKLASCHINGQTCWDVLITQVLHDDCLCLLDV